MAFLLRRRSASIVKIVLILTAIWFTIAVLLYMDDGRRGQGHHLSLSLKGESALGSGNILTGGGGGSGGFVGDQNNLLKASNSIETAIDVNSNNVAVEENEIPHKLESLMNGLQEEQQNRKEINKFHGNNGNNNNVNSNNSGGGGGGGGGAGGGGGSGSSSNHKKSNKQVGHAYVDDAEKNVLAVPGDALEKESPGEMGYPVILPTNMSVEMKKLYDDGWMKNAFNQYASDLISVHRNLPDPRDAWCKEPGRYSENLPPTDVIICFHNEAWSVLLRTVHSVLDRSPERLINSIILVDDYSDMPHLKTQLEDYFSTYPKVKIVRATKREGLIRARLLGAKYANAPVLTYLDSHCECTIGWLEPLLDRIARNSTTVVCPVIDVIDDTTLEYHWRDSGGVNVGGFDWNLQFNWHAVPERERARHKTSAEPVWSPTMAGGLFSIDRDFFYKLGTYDPDFDIWGGENLELSFKTWMCGGTLEIVPCSHVGHIFRKRSPYKWKSGVNVLKRNSVRLAEVWLDEYGKYYYQRIGNERGDYGDVTARRELRRRLGCKNFKWYLDNIYPELFIPGDAVASGEIRNLGYGGRTCLDSPAKRKDLKKAVSLYPCHRQGGNQIANLDTDLCLDSAVKSEDMQKPINLWGCHGQGGNQYWMYSKTGEIRRDEACLDYAGHEVMLYPCHGSRGNQFWSFNEENKQLRHGSSDKCLAINEAKDKVIMEECDTLKPRQKWSLENYDASKL